MRNIKKTKPITDYERAVKYGIWLLSRADYTAFMIKEKLIRKECPEEIAEKAVGYLTERGYIDDYDYAQRLVNQLTEIRKKGKLYVRFELKKKGVCEEIIEELMAECESDVDSAMENALRKYSKPVCELEYKELASLKAKLMRQGFSSSEINDCIRRMKELV